MAARKYPRMVANGRTCAVPAKSRARPLGVPPRPGRRSGRRCGSADSVRERGIGADRPTWRDAPARRPGVPGRRPNGRRAPDESARSAPGTTIRRRRYCGASLSAAWARVWASRCAAGLDSKTAVVSRRTWVATGWSRAEATASARRSRGFDHLQSRIAHTTGARQLVSARTTNSPSPTRWPAAAPAPGRRGPRRCAPRTRRR